MDDIFISTTVYTACFKSTSGRVLKAQSVCYCNKSVFLRGATVIDGSVTDVVCDVMQVRRRYGCFDEVLQVEKREVRHCNWVRFLRATTNMNDVNMIARRVNKQPQFQVIKPLPVNAELKVRVCLLTPHSTTTSFEEFLLFLQRAAMLALQGLY